MNEALTDPRCVVTAEALVLDGTNGVCRDARLGSRGEIPWRAGALALGVLLLALLLISRAARARAVITALSVALAIPGLLAMATVRADRPTELAHTAAEVRALHDAIRGFAERHGCARVALDRCAACEPIARLALAGLTCDAPATIELHEGALGRGCLERGGALVCGGEAPP